MSTVAVKHFCSQLYKSSDSSFDLLVLKFIVISETKILDNLLSSYYVPATVQSTLLVFSPPWMLSGRYHSYPHLTDRNGNTERLSHLSKVTQPESVEQRHELRQSDFRADIWNNSLPHGCAGGVVLEQGLWIRQAATQWGISASEGFIFIPRLPSLQGCFGNEQGQYPTGKKKRMTHEEEGGGGNSFKPKDTIFHTGGGRWMHHRGEMDLRGHMDNSPTFGEDTLPPEKWFKRILAAARGSGYLCWTAPRSMCFIKLTRCPV